VSLGDSSEYLSADSSESVDSNFRFCHLSLPTSFA
jgi:hypothetical protein